MIIEGLLSQSEGKTLEFKRDLSSPKGLMKTLVAFSNTAGGRVIVGIDDDKRVIGVERPLDEEERLCSLIADSIKPRLVPNVELVTVEGKTLLIVEVFLSNSRPHYLAVEGPDQGVYVRLGSSNRQADRELVGELRRSAEGVSYDELPMPELSEDDLDLKAARRLFKGRRALDEQELLTLKLMRREQGRLVPTRGGMLLFGRDRVFHYPDAWVQCGRFIGNDKGDIFDHIELEESLPESVESVMLFLRKHAMRGADFSEIQRKDVWSIPIDILREVVINALVHSDYSQRGAPVRVAFFDDRIEVENPGILMPGMTIEDMKSGVSKIRNPVIARVFRELKLIEQWGSGVRNILRAVAELKLPEPLVQEIGMRVRFTVYLAKPHILKKQTVGSRTSAVTGLVDGAQSRAQSRAQSKLVLTALQSGSLSASEIACKLELESKTGAFKRLIKDLTEEQLIEYTLPDKPNSRLQKYRLTEAGRAFLASMDS
ncbi:helix-turn-helix domain-containing protein [Erysipelotrichia bacterium]